MLVETYTVSSVFYNELQIKDQQKLTNWKKV